MLLRFTRNQYIWCFLIESYSKLVWFTMTKRWHKKFLNVAFDLDQEDTSDVFYHLDYFKMAWKSPTLRESHFA